MLFEELHGVIAEAAKKVVELAFVRVVDAEFIDSGRGLRHGRVSSRRRVAGCGSGPGCGWEKRCDRNRLKQCASVHGRDCSRGSRDGKRRPAVCRTLVGVTRKKAASTTLERERVDGVRVLRRAGEHHDSAEIAGGRAAAPNHRKGGRGERRGIVLWGHDFDTSDGGTPPIARGQYMELEDG